MVSVVILCRNQNSACSPRKTQIPAPYVNHIIILSAVDYEKGDILCLKETDPTPRFVTFLSCLSITTISVDAFCRLEKDMIALDETYRSDQKSTQ